MAQSKFCAVVFSHFRSALSFGLSASLCDFANCGASTICRTFIFMRNLLARVVVGSVAIWLAEFFSFGLVWFNSVEKIWLIWLFLFDKYTYF